MNILSNGQKDPTLDRAPRELGEPREQHTLTSLTVKTRRHTEVSTEGDEVRIRKKFIRKRGRVNGSKRK